MKRAWLLVFAAALPALADPAASAKLEGLVRRAQDSGWEDAWFARAAEAEAVTAALAEVREIEAAPLSVDERVDARLLEYRLSDMLEARRIHDSDHRQAAAWLPRPGGIAAAAAALRDGGKPDDAVAALEGMASLAAESRSWLRGMTVEDEDAGLAAIGETEKEISDARGTLSQPAEVAGAADSLRAALADLRRFLENEKKTSVKQGPEEARLTGWAEFERRLRWQIGVEWRPIDVFRLGREQFAATERELERTARLIDPAKSWREIAAGLREDHPTPDGLLEAASDEMHRALAFAKKADFVTIPDFALKVDVRWGPADSPTPYGHYIPCDPADPELKGWYEVTPVTRLKGADLEEVLRGNNRCWIRVVSLHEAIPGHHLQFAIAARRTDELRKHFYNTSYVEGWGLYCEETMNRFGYYDARTRLSQLKMRLWRCARAVIDVGVHLGGMTREQAIDLLVDRVGMERASAAMEVDRYIAAPGYYSGYLIGLTRFENLRSRVRKTLGAAFREKEFNDRLLSFGPLPFRVIEEAMEAPH